MGLLEFTLEGPQRARPKASVTDCVVDCGGEVEAFNSTGLEPQLDPSPVARPAAYSVGHESTGVRLDPYVPGQPAPQADPQYVASPLGPQPCCTPGGTEGLVTTQTGLDPAPDPIPVVRPKK